MDQDQTSEGGLIGSRWFSETAQVMLMRKLLKTTQLLQRFSTHQAAGEELWGERAWPRGGG